MPCRAIHSPIPNSIKTSVKALASFDLILKFLNINPNPAYPHQPPVQNGHTSLILSVYITVTLVSIIDMEPCWAIIPNNIILKRFYGPGLMLRQTCSANRSGEWGGAVTGKSSSTQCCHRSIILSPCSWIYFYANQQVTFRSPTNTHHPGAISAPGHHQTLPCLPTAVLHADRCGARIRLA